MLPDRSAGRARLAGVRPGGGHGAAGGQQAGDNARKSAPGPFLLTFELSGDTVEISVWDTEPRLPVLLAADPQRVGQHGLEIVTAVCQRFEVHREPVGKRVVAAIALADDPVGDLAGPPDLWSGGQVQEGGVLGATLRSGRPPCHEGDRGPRD